MKQKNRKMKTRVKEPKGNTVEPVYSGYLQFLEKAGVRYIEVFNISRRKGKNNFYGDARVVGKRIQENNSEHRC